MDFTKLNDITPELDEDIKEKIEAEFHRMGYIFKENKSHTAYCTCCENRFPLNALRIDGIEIRPTSSIKRYRHNDTADCPICDAPVIIKDAGRGRGNVNDYMYLGVFQVLNDGSLVLRTFLCNCYYGGSYENVKVDYSEKYRVYFCSNGRYSFQKYWNAWKEISRLPACERYQWGMYSYFDIFYINPECVEESEIFKFSDFSSFSVGISTPLWLRYLDYYHRHPVITERLIKAGFENVVKAAIDGKLGSYVNYKADTISGFLRMNKSELKFLKKLQPYKISYAVTAKSYHLELNEKTLFFLSNETYSFSMIKDFVKRNNLDYDADYIVKYLIKQQSNFSLFLDYYRWLKKYKFEIDKKRLFPRYFLKEHDYMMLYDKRMEAQKEQKKKQKEVENFKSNILPLLIEKYTYKSSEYVIRPFNDIVEIIEEGQKQNICVGNEYYTNAYIKGRTILLCLRKNKHPNTSYCTVELSLKGKIIQARMHHNQQTPTEVKEFLNEWQQYYKSIKPKKREVA